MEKLRTRKQRERINRRNQIIIGIILIGIMAFGGVGFLNTSTKGDALDSEDIEYNGIMFIKNGDSWNFQTSNGNFITRYNPNQTKDIIFTSQTSVQDYINKPLYLVSPPGETFAEISSNLVQFPQRINNACLRDLECLGDYPIKNCSVDNVIIIREPVEKEPERVYNEEKCFFIVSEYANQTKYADAFLFGILDVN